MHGYNIILFQVGLYVLQILDSFAVGGFSLFLLTLLEIIAISYIYGLEKFYSDVAVMIGYKPTSCFKICFLFLAPISLTVSIRINGKIIKNYFW